MFNRPYTPGTDYKTLFMAEFRDRVDKVAGNDVKIWDGFKSDKLEEWIKRWVKKKTLSEKKWYSKKNYYNAFYEQTYVPYMDIFASYILKGNEAKKAGFWRWFLNVYLRENKYP